MTKRTKIMLAIMLISLVPATVVGYMVYLRGGWQAISTIIFLSFLGGLPLSAVVISFIESRHRRPQKR